MRLYLLIACIFALVGIASNCLAASAGYVIAANKGDHAIGIIDPKSGKQVAEIDAGGITPHEVVASPDGKYAFAPIYGDSGVGKPGTDGATIAVIDLAARKLVNHIDLGKGLRPHCPIFNPVTGVLYVTTELQQAVTVIDPGTFKIVGTIPTGQSESHMLAVSPDGKWGYTANVGPGTVSVLDLTAKKTVAIIPISGNTQRISITPDGKKVFTADQTQPRMAVIDTATRQVSGWLPLPAPGYGTAVTPNGKWLIVAVPAVHKVVAIDLDSGKISKSLDVPAAPQEVLISPDGGTAWVSCDKSGKIAQIDTSSWTVSRLIDAGKTVDGLAWVQ